MKNNKILVIVLSVAALAGVLLFFLRKPKTETTPVDSKASLPINIIPANQRPFVTLTPDSSGRNLTLGLDNSTLKEIIEYELVYDAGDKQEGAFGRINLATEAQPVAKKLLLGSQSGGGKITYHEGITGGSLTLTYEDTRLKESFNFLRFDADKESYSSVDSRFSAEFTPRSLTNNSVVVIMKPFGLPADIEGEILAGPYAVLTAAETSPSLVTILTSQGIEGSTPTVYGFTGGEWVKLESTQKDKTLSISDPDTNIFVVVSK